MKWLVRAHVVVTELVITNLGIKTLLKMHGHKKLGYNVMFIELLDITKRL